MKTDRQFLIHTGIVLSVAVVMAAYPLAMFGTREVIVAAVAGCVLSTMNAVAGSMTIEYALDKPPSTFLKAVLGGMGVRMAVVLVLFYLMIRFLGFHTVALTVSLLGFYAIFLALEVLNIQRKVEIRHRS